MMNRATAYFYYKNPFNFLYQKGKKNITEQSEPQISVWACAIIKEINKTKKRNSPNKICSNLQTGDKSERA